MTLPGKDHFGQLLYLIKNAECENAQQIQSIEQERELITKLKVELEGKVSDTLRFNQEAAEAKEKCEQREKKLSQVIETLTSLKRTGLLLEEHMAVVRKKIAFKEEEFKKKRQHNSDLLTKYQRIWVDYEEKYKSFDYVQEFESKRQEAEWVKGKAQEQSQKMEDLEWRINSLRLLCNRTPCEESLEWNHPSDIVVQIALVLRDKLRTEAEIDKNHLILNQLKEKIGDMKAKLPSLKNKENLVQTDDSMLDAEHGPPAQDPPTTMDENDINQAHTGSQNSCSSSLRPVQSTTVQIPVMSSTVQTESRTALQSTTNPAMPSVVQYQLPNQIVSPVRNPSVPSTPSQSVRQQARRCGPFTLQVPSLPRSTRPSTALQPSASSSTVSPPVRSSTARIGPVTHMFRPVVATTRPTVTTTRPTVATTRPAITTTRPAIATTRPITPVVRSTSALNRQTAALSRPPLTSRITIPPLSSVPPQSVQMAVTTGHQLFHLTVPPSPRSPQIMVPSSPRTPQPMVPPSPRPPQLMVPPSPRPPQLMVPPDPRPPQLMVPPDPRPPPQEHTFRSPPPPVHLMRPVTVPTTPVVAVSTSRDTVQSCSGSSNLPGSSLVDGTVVMEVGGEKDGGGSTGPQTISASLSSPRKGQDEASSAAHTTVGGEDRSGPEQNKCREEMNGKDDRQRGGPSEPPASTEDRDLCSEGDTRTEVGQSTPTASFLQQQGTSPSPQDACLFSTNEAMISESIPPTSGNLFDLMGPGSGTPQHEPDKSEESTTFFFNSSAPQMTPGMGQQESSGMLMFGEGGRNDSPSTTFSFGFEPQQGVSFASNLFGGSPLPQSSTDDPGGRSEGQMCFFSLNTSEEISDTSSGLPYF